MENIGNIIANNLIYLRKKASLTQLEFGEKVNYSDKTVSKWELATVVPSVETLKEIADFYGVSLDYLVTEHKSQKDYASTISKTVNAKNRITFISLINTILLCIAVVIYVAGYIKLNTIDPSVNRYWIAFIWFIPLCLIVTAYLTTRYFKGSKWSVIFLSAAIWTLLLSAFITFLNEENYWFLFIIGFPVQAVIFFGAKLRSK